MVNPTFFRKWLVLLALALLAATSFAKDTGGLPNIAYVNVAELPKEAQTTLKLIKQGGPFAYDKDGVVFGNYETRLPKQKRGYYHEYTVKTPRARNRGARRIIAGADPQTSGEYYYTEDHYESFRRIKE
ncbi:ribonuclease [Undibacterium sp. CY18W]|uniref:Ribonuclease n=1 Tax=Undibacterium hunanense TaxID=2762292 RepID=A0ABR6ZR39_9BURK|nr:ribonuclease [Undibacterium hunanense]MBC3918337.1 ribonuclease [Undibacterium hunanense]